MLKPRKWYSTHIKPDRTYQLIVMTDMGYVFESIYEEGVFKISVVRDNKVYFETYENQDSLIKWMKI